MALLTGNTHEMINKISAKVLLWLYFQTNLHLKFPLIIVFDIRRDDQVHL